MTNPRVTIYDIAKEAGTSPSTVSRVLNHSALVNGATTREVMAVAERLGYSKRRIRRHASRAILHVVVFLPHGQPPQTHLFYDAAELISGVQRGFGDVRAHLIVSLSDSTDELTAKKLGDIDGCIFAFSSPSPLLRATLRSREIPAVLINRVDRQFSFVANDARAGMRKLLDTVRQSRPDDRICFISVEDAKPVAMYRETAVVDGGAGIDPSDVRWYSTVTDITCEVVKDLFDRGYRVFMCVNDFVAAAVHDRLSRLGIAVPESAGVTGYDAAPVRALLSREIPTVDLSVAELGEQAADLLRDMIVDRCMDRVERYVTGRFLSGSTL